MGIANRDYYRAATADRPDAWGITTVVKTLILVNVVVFVLQLVVTRSAAPPDRPRLHHRQPDLDADADDLTVAGPKVSVIQEWCQLDTRKVLHGEVWRLITHAFCHDRSGVWHIIINMLCLFYFGPTLESMYGPREFLLFYLTAAVVAGLTLVGMDLYTGTAVPAVGASGAVIGVMMLYTVHFPRETICLFWFFPVEMRWVMLFYLIYDVHPLLLALSGERFSDGVAHAAHLGGLAFGFLYGRCQWRLEPLFGLAAQPRRAGYPRSGSPAALRSRPVAAAVADDEPVTDMDQVDDILRKIAVSGQASLTAEERAVLTAASERMKRCRR